MCDSGGALRGRQRSSLQLRQRVATLVLFAPHHCASSARLPGLREVERPEVPTLDMMGLRQ